MISFILTLLAMNHPASDEALIRAARAESNKAIAAHQARQMGSFFTEDYHIITSRNAETAGKEANIARFQSELDVKPDVVYVRTPQTIQVFDEWKMASEQGVWEGSWTEKGEKIKLSGTYFAKWHKLEGRWLIRAEIFVPLKCEGGEFCRKGPL